MRSSPKACQRLPASASEAEDLPQPLLEVPLLPRALLLLLRRKRNHQKRRKTFPWVVSLIKLM